jgi:hypothetical protein
LGDDNAAGGFRILGPRREGAASTDRTKLLETTLWCAQQLRLSRPENPGIAPEEQAAFTRTGAVWVDVGELRVGKVSISGTLNVTRYAGVGSNNLEKERGEPIATRIDGRVDASSALKEDHCSQLFWAYCRGNGEGSPLEGIEHLAYRLQATLGRPLSHRDIHGAQVRPLRKERNGVVTLHNSAGYLILLASQCDEETYVLAAPF